MIKIGIIGIGSIAMDYLELIIAGKVKGCHIAALCSRNQEKIIRVREEISSKDQIALFTDYRELISSGTCDAVLICTPHKEHPKIAEYALQNKVHVLVEKPVGTDSNEVTHLLEVREHNADCVCGVMYNRRMSKAYQFIRKKVNDGVLGELVRVTWTITNLYRTVAYYSSSPWRGTWKEEGGGILMTQASHQLDLLQWICGPIQVEKARCATVDRDLEVENDVEILFTLNNNAHGQFIASAHEAPGTNRLEICGTRGSMIIEDDSKVRLIRLREDERCFSRESKLPFAKPDYEEESFIFDDSDNKVQQAAALQNFVDCVKGKTTIFCSLEEGAKSFFIIKDVYANALGKGNANESKS